MPFPSSPLPGTKLAAYVAQQARGDARSEIDAAAAGLIALVAAEIERPTDLSLAEALEDWTRGDAGLAGLRAAIEPMSLLGVDEARRERTGEAMRLAVRAA